MYVPLLLLRDRFRLWSAMRCLGPIALSFSSSCRRDFGNARNLTARILVKATFDWTRYVPYLSVISLFDCLFQRLHVVHSLRGGLNHTLVDGLELLQEFVP